MSVYILDTETTGHEQGAEPIELSIARVAADLAYEPVFYGRYKPQQRILFTALAVHHILPQELEESPPSAQARKDLPVDMEYMVGHNIDYDWEVLGRPACRRICTLALARKLWPSFDGHSQSALCYHLAEPEHYVEVRDTLKHAHGAGADVEICYSILRGLLATPQMRGMKSWEEIWRFSEEARIPEIWTFGKHKGKRIGEADRGYLFWCKRQPDMDPYVKIAVDRALNGGLGESSHDLDRSE